MSFDPVKIFKRIQLPPQDIDTLMYCRSNKPAQVKKWAEALPATQIQKTSSLLYKALPEIARLKTDPQSRLLMLESLRPYVQSCIQGLSKDFLNKPLILPDDAVKSATIAQALQKHMTTAYEVASRDLCLNNKAANAKQKQMLTQALHRAISGLGLQLMRSYQLYIPIQGQHWVQLHSLYQLAEHWECTSTTVMDTTLIHSTGCSIQQAYLRILLLASARPNQLRQIEVNAIYSALELWATHSELNAGTNDRNNLFVTNLSSDQPPIYKSRFQGNESDDIRELDTRNLITAINKHANSATPQQKKLSIGINSGLLTHLENAWSISRQRNFERRLSKGELEITVGLSNLHFHLADQTPFKDLLHGDGHSKVMHASLDKIFDAKPLSAEIDPWAQSFDAGGTHVINSGMAGGSHHKAKDTSLALHPIATIMIMDTSPGGYCLKWGEDIPQQVRAGEVIGLREPGRRTWSIALIRWVSQSKGGSQLGIQVLSPQAQAVGASIIHKTGDKSEFLRALLLPEVKTIDQPASLLTASVPFYDQAKITLNDKGEERKAQLVRQLLTTGTVAQFAFRELENTETRAKKTTPKNERVPEKKASSKPGFDDFDSLWD